MADLALTCRIPAVLDRLGLSGEDGGWLVAWCLPHKRCDSRGYRSNIERHLPPEPEKKLHWWECGMDAGPRDIALASVWISARDETSEQTTTTRLSRRSTSRSRDVAPVGCVFPCI